MLFNWLGANVEPTSSYTSCTARVAHLLTSFTSYFAMNSTHEPTQVFEMF